MPKRNLTLDLLRTVAILLMVITHVAFFWYAYDHFLTNWLADLGGWICLSLFVFVSGGTFFILWGVKPEHSTPQHYLRRALNTYVWLVALAVIGSHGQQVWGIVTGEYTVPLTDFLWLFVFLFILTAIVTATLTRERLQRNWLWLIGLAPVLYLAGWWSYAIAPLTPPQFHVVLSHVVGYHDWHRFPLLQYGSLYLLGMVWGMFHQRLKWWHYWGASVILALTYAVLLPHIPFDRWSVSPTFWLYSATAITLLLALARLLQFAPRLVIQWITIISSHSLAVMVIHTLILFLASWWWTTRFGGLLFWGMYLTILSLSLTITIVWRYSLKAYRSRGN